MSKKYFNLHIKDKLNQKCVVEFNLRMNKITLFA